MQHKIKIATHLSLKIQHSLHLIIIGNRIVGFLICMVYFLYSYSYFINDMYNLRNDHQLLLLTRHPLYYPRQRLWQTLLRLFTIQSFSHKSSLHYSNYLEILLTIKNTSAPIVIISSFTTLFTPNKLDFWLANCTAFQLSKSIP